MCENVETHLKGECSMGDVGVGLDAGQGLRDGLETGAPGLDLI